jgi:hypothetical protein
VRRAAKHHPLSQGTGYLAKQTTLTAESVIEFLFHGVRVAIRKGVFRIDPYRKGSITPCLLVRSFQL